MQGKARGTSSKQKVYRYVKDAIISLSIRPGDMLFERDIAQSLGVSRTPVREALQELQDEGWLAVMPRKGTVVRPLSRVEIDEVMQMRSVVGAAGITLSAGRIGAGDLAFLKSLIARQEDAALCGDYPKFVSADMALHVAMVRLSGNRRLIAVAEDLLDNFRRIAIESLQQDRGLDLIIDDHKAIVGALEQENRDEARRLLVEHIERARRSLLTRSFSPADGSSPSDSGS